MKGYSYWLRDVRYHLNIRIFLTYTRLFKQEYKLLCAYVEKKKPSWNKNTIEMLFVWITDAKQLDRNPHSIKMVKTELF